MEVTRHFTVSTYIVHEDTVLLHFHKQLNLWLPVGGHIDRDELPQEAAIREAKEEAGLDIILQDIQNRTLTLNDTKQLISPAHFLLQNINEFHQHIDFVYYAITRTNTIFPGEGESNTLKWFTKDDLQKHELIDNVYSCSLECLTLLSQRKETPNIF